MVEINQSIVIVICPVFPNIGPQSTFRTMQAFGTSIADIKKYIMRLPGGNQDEKQDMV